MTLLHLRRRIRRILTLDRLPPSVASVFTRHRAELTRSILLVRFFYVACMFVMVHQMLDWDAWAEVEVLYPIWPVSWVERVGVQTGIEIVLGVSLVGSIAAALLPEYRLPRIMVAVGLLMHTALNNSLAGAIVAHGLHAWVFISWWFIFLPSGSPEHVAASRPRAQRFTSVVWCAQATIMMFYSIGGLFKVAGAVLQLSRGQAHGFAVDALARHTAFRILEGAELPAYFAAGPTLIENPWIGLVYPFVILLEVFAIIAAFRPAVHRVYAVGLLAMHLGIYFFMTIMFSTQVLMLGILFLCSPFSPTRVVWRDVLLQFPVIGDVLTWMRRWARRREGGDVIGPRPEAQSSA